MDRTTFLLRTRDQIKEFTDLMKSNPEKLKYLSSVCKLLDKMIPGQVLQIDNLVKPENIEVFIKSVCLYMDAWPSLKIEFTNDLTGIRKRVNYESK